MCTVETTNLASNLRLVVHVAFSPRAVTPNASYSDKEGLRRSCKRTASAIFRHEHRSFMPKWESGRRGGWCGCNSWTCVSASSRGSASACSGIDSGCLFKLQRCSISRLRRFPVYHHVGPRSLKQAGRLHAQGMGRQLYVLLVHWLMSAGPHGCRLSARRVQRHPVDALAQ